MAKPHHLDPQVLSLTVSIGVSLYPGDGTDAETLIKNADVAMYHAKEGARGIQFFRPRNPRSDGVAVS